MEKVGYRKTEDENSISYAQNELVFLISFLPNSEESDIMIHFKKENQSFSVGWICLLYTSLEFDLPASFGCESVTEKYSVPVLPLPPAESEQRSFDFII